MRSQDLIALQRIVAHYEEQERVHFCTCFQSQREDHIYRDLLTLQQYLKRVKAKDAGTAKLLQIAVKSPVQKRSIKCTQK